VFHLSSEIVNACHKNNIRVNVWSVDDKSAIKQMISNKVDTIITNYPERALKILENNKLKYQ